MISDVEKSSLVCETLADVTTKLPAIEPVWTATRSACPLVRTVTVLVVIGFAMASTVAPVAFLMVATSTDSSDEDS